MRYPDVSDPNMASFVTVGSIGSMRGEERI